MKLLHSALSHALIFVLAIVVDSAIAKAQVCRPNGKVRGTLGECHADYGAACCKKGEFYPTYKCSPPVRKHTKAILTINSFKGELGAPSECDNQYHPEYTSVVALSTGWFDNRKRCDKEITIHGNGRSVKAKVVDEYNSTMGCNAARDLQSPCPNNIVDASKAVWKSLGVPESDWGEMEIFWSED